MATAVPSRFAVLSIDDDDYKPKKVQKPATSGNRDAKNSKNDKQKQQPKKDDKKKPNKNKKKKGNNDSQQWEQWKQKDSMAVEEAYEQDLCKALLLSTLAYESQVENGGSTKDQEETKKSSQGSKKKKSTMSLQEFNNLAAPAIVTEPNVLDQETKDNKIRENDTEFFDRVDKEAREAIAKSKENDMLKTRLNQLDDDITSAQLKVEVEKRDEVIAELRLQIDGLKDELAQVKSRNKKLYQILSQGEMKDKASVLAEVTKLQEIREELTLEVTNLHAQLEQERSKTRASITDVKTTKQNNKKRLVSENA